MDCTPGRVTPTVAGKQMSSQLREKLKRCGRYHCSPLSSKKTMSVASPLAVLHRGDNSATPISDTGCTIVTPYRNRQYSADGAVFTLAKGGKRLFGNSPAGKMAQAEDDLHQSEDEACAISEQRKDAVGVKRLSTLKVKKEIKLNIDEERTDKISQSSNSSSKCNKAFPNATITHCDQSHYPLPKRLCLDNESETLSLAEKKRSLQKVVEEKRETLRKLKMVQLYRKKNDLDQLETLICKWRGVSQQGLEELHERLPEPKPSLTDLVNHLQLDHKLIGFNPEEETFN